LVRWLVVPLALKTPVVADLLTVTLYSQPVDEKLPNGLWLTHRPQTK